MFVRFYYVVCNNVRQSQTEFNKNWRQNHNIKVEQLEFISALRCAALRCADVFDDLDLHVDKRCNNFLR